MFTPYGNQLYGRIDECGTTYLATRFFHVWWMPLIPSETVLVLTQGGSDYHFFPQPRSWRSLLAALLRTWGLLLIFFPGIPLMVGALARAQAHAGPMVIWFVLHAAAVAYAYIGLGRLSAKQQAQRMVYSSFVDFPVDVARVGKFFPDLRRNLRDELNRLARAQLGGRGGLTGQFDHALRAADPQMLDIDYLRAGLVLTRLEWSETHGQERAKRAAQHAAIWAKLVRLNAASVSGQGADSRVPQRQWVELNPQAKVTPPPTDYEKRVPEREWVDVNANMATSATIVQEVQTHAPIPGTPIPARDSAALRLAARRRLQPQSAAKTASRPQRSLALVVIIGSCVVLGALGLGALRVYHKRTLAAGGEEAVQAEMKSRSVEGAGLPEVKPLPDAAACHLNLPRTWKASTNKEEGTPYRSLGATNPSGDMNLHVAMRPLDSEATSEEQLAQKLAEARPDKHTLVEAGWLTLPLQRAWREVRSLSAEEPALTEVNYFIRKPAADIHVRARLASRTFPQFRKFIEDIMRTVYCDEPDKPRVP